MSEAARERRGDRRTHHYRIALALALGCAVGLAATAVVLATRPRPSSTTIDAPRISGRPVGAPLPVDFRLARLGGGAPVELADLLRGRPAVVNLFASWCTACEKELRAFGLVSSDLRRKVVFVGIDTSEPSPGRSIALLRKAGARYPVGLDTSSSTVADRWGVSALPVTFFLRSDGTIAKEVLGAESAAQLAEAARALLRSG